MNQFRLGYFYSDDKITVDKNNTVLTNFFIVKEHARYVFVLSFFANFF